MGLDALLEPHRTQGSEAKTTIHGAEAVSITYPGFIDALTALGGAARETE